MDLRVDAVGRAHGAVEEPGRRRAHHLPPDEGVTRAVAVAGIATAIVVALWFAFYFLVFLPRGSVQ